MTDPTQLAFSAIALACFFVGWVSGRQALRSRTLPRATATRRQRRAWEAERRKAGWV